MTGWYESDGARLSYRDSGSGVPIVFLHPTPLDHDYWRLLIDDLAGVRAIVPDFRGHGRSELGKDLPVGGFARVPDAPVLSIGQLAADVVALLDHLQVHEAVFAGCSIGGYVLLELWRRVPQRMQGLAFHLLQAAAGRRGQPRPARGQPLRRLEPKSGRSLRRHGADIDWSNGARAASRRL